jgi:hypothetical protein
LDTHITEDHRYYDYDSSGPSIYADKDGLPVSFILPELKSGPDVFNIKTQFPAVVVKPVYTAQYTQDKHTGKYVTEECKMKMSYKLFIEFINCVPIVIQRQANVLEFNNPECRARALCLSRFPKTLGEH